MKEGGGGGEGGRGERYEPLCFMGDVSCSVRMVDVTGPLATKYSTSYTPNEFHL